MNKIDDDLLKALFDLSSLEYEPERDDYWQAELVKWLSFFEIGKVDVATGYQNLSNGSSDELREDVVEDSLSAQKLKSFMPRLADGFVALPQGVNNEGE